MKTTTDRTNVLKVAWHRNGISGEGFHTALFTFNEGGKQHRMVAVRFGDAKSDRKVGGVQCAVLDVDLLKKGVIEMGQNSWRGDHFVDAIDAAIAAFEHS